MNMTYPIFISMDMGYITLKFSKGGDLTNKII